ncbi:hypothetical protein PVK06_042020 [Gossypium arboreum]|uniref:Reverse transcriptase zinc-binding domain-containing protein n=1 Tax=Gossypium arboreum TaxID=29729 RepID=A0ABR0N9V3_GOSAR|nr:hypothetical protein PVK06_042020 [Gossypium arboreum]
MGYGMADPNGKITNSRCKWERMVDMLLSTKTKNVLKATNIGKTKASKQILCHRNQMKMQWPIQSDLLVIIQVIQETDRKCKDAVLAEAKAKWRLGETIEKLDPQRSKLVWRGDATGEYTVRSGYKRLLQGEDTSEPRHYNNGHTIFYKKLRQTDLPSKVKITIWRLFNNYIPTYCNLHYRRLRSSAVCPRCSDGTETIKHVFRDCIIVKEI